MQPTQSPDTLSVETPESVAFAYDLAGPASRGAALVVDTVLLVLIIAAEGLAVLLVGTLVDSAGAVPWLIAVFAVAAFATYWGYYIFGEVLRNGRTPGKRALGIRVVRDDGGRVGVLDSIIRNLIRIVDLLPGYYAVGLVSVLLSSSNKRLGDMAAGTVVVRDTGDLRTSFGTGELSERTALARDYLARRASFTRAARWQVGCELLALWDEVPAEGWEEHHVAGRIAELAGLLTGDGAAQ